MKKSALIPLLLLLLLPTFQGCGPSRSRTDNVIKTIVPTEITTCAGLSLTVPAGWVLSSSARESTQDCRYLTVAYSEPSYHERYLIQVGEGEKVEMAPSFPIQKDIRKMSESKRAELAKKYEENIGGSPSTLFERPWHTSPKREYTLRRTLFHEVNGRYYVLSRILFKSGRFFMVKAETEIDGRVKGVQVTYATDRATPEMAREAEAIINSIRLIPPEAQP